MLSAHMTVDTSGTRCPIPLLKAKQALKQLAQGQRVQVISTDPSSVGDFNAMLKHLPHQLISSSTRTVDDQRIFEFLIEKG